MIFDMRYGHGEITFDLPEKNVLSYIDVKDSKVNSDNVSVLKEAFDKPVNSPGLPEAAADRSVCLLIEDATRDVAVEDIFNVISRELVSARSVNAIICSGTHNPSLPGNDKIISTLRQHFLSSGIENFEITIHDSRSGEFENCGTTNTGNRVLVNSSVNKAEFFVVLSDMKNHYFAGYSNGVKNFFPGVLALETTERNHALAFDERATFGHHPWHPDVNRRNNPLAQDMVEGLDFILNGRPAYVLATIQKSHRIIWSEYGDLKTVSANGMLMVDQLMSQTVEPSEMLIVSPGGYPNDETIYTAQRALELSKTAVKKGGKILFLAECRNGIGPPSALENFYNILAQPLEEVLTLPEKKYILYSHKPYKFARLIEKCPYLGMYSKLERAAIEKIHLKNVDDPVQLIQEELQLNPDLTINLVNNGNKIALHTGNS